MGIEMIGFRAWGFQGLRLRGSSGHPQALPKVPHKTLNPMNPKP